MAAGLAGIEATFAAGAMFNDLCGSGGLAGATAGPVTIVPVSR